MLGIRERDRRNVTEEEVKFAIAEGTEAGVIDEVEEEMIHGVLGLADRSVASIMTPRPDVYWIDLDDEPDTIARDVAECPYSRIVVARDGDMSHPLGVVQKKDLVQDLIAGRACSSRRSCARRRMCRKRCRRCACCKSSARCRCTSPS